MCTYLLRIGPKYYFRRQVPKDLVGHFRTATGKPRTEWRYTLGTNDREEAKRLLRPHAADTDRLIDEARARVAASVPEHPTEPPQKPAESKREAEEAQAAEAVQKRSQARYEARSEYRRLARERMLLSTVELTDEEASWRDLVREREQELDALREAVEGQRAFNDRLAAENQRTAGSIPLMPLFERYAATGSASAVTIKKWRPRVASLIEHLGHDDAARITRADLNSWVASLVAGGLTKKTITGQHLAAVRLALSIAHDDGLLPDNPAKGLTVRAPKPTKLRSRDLSDDEARTILEAALQPQPKDLASSHALARRWVPWIMAYTGARVGEVCQLRRMDLREENGVPVIVITPDAGSVKTHEARTVPIHPHLLEQGLMQLAKPGDATPLFYEAGSGSEVNTAPRLRAARLGEWVRSLGVTVPQPNHCWRHRFKTVARGAGIESYIADVLQGHAPSNEGGRYGETPLGVLRDAVCKLPRYEVKGT
ncbi:MAG: tyrosine-type recombinase/integrase, partial [Erythrobacter sp.]